jgi:uncharacterized SAM-binding protein YcdF (DUF218 family)
MDYPDVPSSKNFPGTPADKPTEVVYQEGIYVGYRYYDSFNVKPAYEFGYGLSYTTFSVSKPKLSATQFKDKITVSVDVTNTGSVAGKEVVELYLGAPAKSLDKPVKELKAFAKTSLLQPGKKQTVTFTLEPRNLASFNTQTSSWMADAGEYTIHIGTSSRNILQTAAFSMPKELLILKENKAKHTFDNANLSWKVLRDNNINVKKAILVCKGYHSRRALLTYKTAFPLDVEFYVSPVLDRRKTTKDNWFLDSEKISLVMGEVSKIGRYFEGEIG